MVRPRHSFISHRKGLVFATTTARFMKSHPRCFISHRKGLVFATRSRCRLRPALRPFHQPSTRLCSVDLLWDAAAVEALTSGSSAIDVAAQPMELRLTRRRILIASFRTLAGFGAQIQAPDDPRNGSPTRMAVERRDHKPGSVLPRYCAGNCHSCW